MSVKLKFHSRYIFEIITEDRLEKVNNIKDIKPIIKYLLDSKKYKDVVLEGEIMDGISVLKMTAVDVKSGLEIVINKIKSVRDLELVLGCISMRIYSIMKFGYNSYNVVFSPQKIDFEQDYVVFRTASKLEYSLLGRGFSPTIYGDVFKLRLCEILNGSYNELDSVPHSVRLLFDKVRAFLVENNFNLGISPQRYENGLKDLLSNPKIKNVIMLANGYHTVKAKGDE